MKSRYIQVLFGLAISAALTVSVLRVLDLGAFAAAIRQADVRFVPVAIATYLFAMVIRSIVWRRLLLPSVSTFALVQIILVGFAVSYVMPLRVGEIARAYLLKNRCGVDYGTVCASLVAERVLDGLAVGGLLLVALVFEPAASFAFALGAAVAVVFGVVLLGLMFASARPDRVSWMIHWIARHLPAQQMRIERIGDSFTRGLHVLRDPRETSRLLALVTCGWLCQFAVFYLLMLAFHLSGALPMAMLGGSVSNFATLLPSAPGFVGTFDAALIKLFVDIQKTSLNTATAYALVVHAVLVIPVVVLGAFILWRANLSLSRVVGRANRPESSRADARPTAPGVAVGVPVAATAINTSMVSL